VIPRLVIASRNDDKVTEIESVLTNAGLADTVVRGLDWPEVDETGSTLEENALLKARVVAEVTGLPALGDDTGLEVAALDGRPGVRTARYAGEFATYEDNYRKLLVEMNGIESREASFRTVVAMVFPDGSEFVASGQLDGVIATEPRGSFGFGYDPVFEVAGKTLGEIREDEKNKMSHRARALRSLITELGL
jgi:XTP/dITP diphosphohydrolase